MILAVRANNPHFRSFDFTVGANVILADRSKSAGGKDTTNALGKSTLIDILDFCLGSNTSPNKGLRAIALQGWTFSIDITIAEKKYSVTRSTANPGFVEIVGDTSGWPEKPDTNKEGMCGLDIKRWRSVLSWAFFGIGKISDNFRYHPSGRSLLSYFTRNQPAAYNTPFKHFDNQKTWDVQLHNAFLLGLNWELAARWQDLKDRKSALEALRQAIKTGVLDGELSSVGELEALRAQQEDKLTKEHDALSSFQVLPQYREIEEQANALTTRLHLLINANVVEKRRRDMYQNAMGSESAPVDSRLESLYTEAGVALPGAVKRTLDDAREFNRKIVENRRQFVEDEVVSLRVQIDERNKEIAIVTDKRAELLQVLSVHGALEELTRLQELHAETVVSVDAITARITQIRQMTTRSDQIKVETVELKQAADVDYEERRQVWSKALKLFADNSEQLYKLPGKLVIDIDDTGYRFDVEIAGSPSEGISKMKIFCYDLMLIAFSRQRNLGIDFLIHDSTIFDGVDPRQRAHALELAATMSKEFGFQYICALNTDAVPTSDFSAGFDFESLVRLRLTDTDPSGSLLGFRY